jgi:hypothetical protein
MQFINEHVNRGSRSSALGSRHYPSAALLSTVPDLCQISAS